MSLSKNTLKIYEFYNSKFLVFGGTVEDYLNNLQVSQGSYTVIKSALEYYHGKIDIKRKKVTSPPVIPVTVVSKSDIHQILISTHNKKHKLILILSYMVGMRPYEIINIKCLHINNNTITILKSKCHPEPRDITIDDYLKMEINEYINKDQNYLFEVNGRRMSIRGIQHLIKQAGNRVNIANLNARSLRHAYATHFLTGNIFHIKSQLGHHGLGATEIYID